MNVLRSPVVTAAKAVIVLAPLLALTECSPSVSLPKGAVGNLGRYNYSPSVIEDEGIRQFWWCSQGVNPLDHSQTSDAIFYESVNMQTLESDGPTLVLAETPGAWDSAFTCNPKVIGGVFENPLGDGQNYTYAMYYVGTAMPGGANNSIGVAFSNDGMHWKKYPQPVVASTSQSGYGVGQPTLYNADHKSAIYMFYEDSTTSHHLAAVSTDGLHFTVQGTVTRNGLNPDNTGATWGDLSHDRNTGEWYAVFNRPLRPASTTGGISERGQYGIELYKIAQESLLTGASSWQQLVTLDTNATGYELNFIAGIVHDAYGDLNLPFYPKIQMYTSISYPATNWEATPEQAGASGRVETWILMPMDWAPDLSPTIPLNRYFNGKVYEVTTGRPSPVAGFWLEQSLGRLYPNPLSGATVPFYACKRGKTDYFVSLDVACEGQRILGQEGYAYSQPESGLNLVALYRCKGATGHFVSRDPTCESQRMDERLGYVVP